MTRRNIDDHALLFTGNHLIEKISHDLVMNAIDEAWPHVMDEVEKLGRGVLLGFCVIQLLDKLKQLLLF
jgi:hypothetical protein